MMKKTSEEINFQPYLDSLKQRKIPWNKFEKFMKDLTSHFDCERLKKLNVILLTELTIHYSDLDRLKYLNVILMAELKNYIENKYNFENAESVNEKNEETQDSPINPEFKDEIIKENENESDSEIQIMIGKNQEEDNPQYDLYENEQLEDIQDSTSIIGFELSEEIIKENEIQIMDGKNPEEVKENLKDSTMR